MSKHQYCDGYSRRDVLRVGALGAAGLSLPSYLQLKAAGAVNETKTKSAIFINLGGGPTHMDTFDLKPDAPEEYRGEFKTIKTNVDGVEISELLPKLAQCADKFTVMRGVSHSLAAHELGTKYMNTGNRPLPSLTFPGYGAVVSKEVKNPPKDLPMFVAIPNTPQTAGFLGIEHAPLSTNASPELGKPFQVRGIALGRGLTVADVDRRQNLLSDLDNAFAGFESDNELLTGLDRFSDQAHEIVTSSRSREAFDVNQEKPEVVARFKHDTSNPRDSQFGMSCLLATRLVTAGVRFVTVNFGGWDMHQNVGQALKGKLPQLDAGLAGLFNTLADNGQLESTAVFVTGEFGRTPKINARAGRDHWPRAMFVLLGGGGIKGGQVLGASDDKGQGPANEGYSPDDIAASFYHALGIDFTKEYHSAIGRPITVVRNGKLIKELFA
ncbi:MAG: DUF1501 domain-containing protein [Planctomycetales bacterium]|nr:DUF1501 domain-containing protein [Planctomycetales bacterium]